MDKIHIGLDVDDVLLHFNSHVHSFFGVPMEKCDYWCEATMNQKFGKGWFMEKIVPCVTFWESQPPLSDPSDIDFEVACYMSAFPEQHYERRVRLLRKYGFPEAPLIVTFDKLSKCRELGITHLVDDKPATIQALLTSEVKGVHFINQHAGFEPVGTYITNLNQLKQHL